MSDPHYPIGRFQLEGARADGMVEAIVPVLVSLDEWSALRLKAGQ